MRFEVKNSAKKKTGAFQGAGWVAALAATALPFASDAHAARTYNMPQAATVMITQRGQEAFRQRLSQVLANNGVDLRTGRLEKFEYKSPNALRLDRLPPRFQAQSTMLRSLRNALTEWLIGFSLNDPKLGVLIENSGYSAPNIDFAIRPDYDLTQSWGGDGTHGIAVYLDVKIPEIRIQAEKVRGFDENNTFLGRFGLNNPFISFRDPARPLVVTVLTRIQVQSNGSIEFETLGVQTNIATLTIQSGFQRPLVMPRVQIRVNDRTMTLETRELERIFISKQPQLVKMAQAHIKDFIETELPGKMNDIAFDKLKAGFDQNKEISAPGVDPYGNGTAFNWGLRLNSLKLDPEFVKIGLSGFVDDPSVTWDDTAISYPRRLPPLLSALPPSEYDLAFAVNLDIFNRVVQLGYMRGGLMEFDNGKGGKMRLLQPPRFATNVGRKGHARMYIKVQQTTNGLDEKIALSSPYEVELELDVRLRRVNCGLGFDIVLDHIKHASIDAQYIRTGLLHGKITEALQEKIDGYNEEFARTEKILAENVGIPDNLFGMQMQIKDLDWDVNGYLNLFMNYGATCP